MQVGILYFTIGSFQIVMLRMVLGVLVVLVSIVERVSSTGVSNSNREVILRSGSKRCNGSKGGVRLGCTGLGPLYISIHHGCDLCFSS